jgi:PleD family two-component response regulator
LKWWKSSARVAHSINDRIGRNFTVTASGAPLRVLVVDDSNTIRRSAEIFLKQGGHEVLLADDGFDACPRSTTTSPSSSSATF